MGGGVVPVRPAPTRPGVPPGVGRARELAGVHAFGLTIVPLAPLGLPPPGGSAAIMAALAASAAPVVPPLGPLATGAPSLPDRSPLPEDGLDGALPLLRDPFVDRGLASDEGAGAGGGVGARLVLAPCLTKRGWKLRLCSSFTRACAARRRRRSAWREKVCVGVFVVGLRGATDSTSWP